jgi:hypothetical protein
MLITWQQIADELVLTDALSSNRSDDGTPDWYIVEPENLEYLVQTVFKIAGYLQQDDPMRRALQDNAD